MQQVPSFLSASSHPFITGAVYIAFGLYLLALVATLVRPAWGRWPMASGAVVHLAATAARGVAIGFFPLTNKFESFSAAALAVSIVAVITWNRHRAYGMTMVLVAITALGAALTFPMDLVYPPPLMYTIWYPLHVPLSFFAYALWVAAAASAIAWLVGGHARVWLARMDRLALQGFGLWSLSMICGGIWGVLAWGAYFLWDPKVVWSVVLWFHYATFIHIRFTPSLQKRAWVRPAMALAGFVFVLVAYVGTSFLFGKSSHAF